MTVQELITKLGKFPNKYAVLVAVDGDFFEVQRVNSFEKGYVEVSCGNSLEDEE